MLANQRSLFALPEDLHYLNCASRSPLPLATESAGRTALENQLVPVSSAVEEYFAAPELMRSRVAELVGTSADRVAITPAVSYGIQIAALNWPLSPGQVVVVPEEEFPSDVYGWIAACERSGAAMRTVPRPDNGANPATRWSKAMVDAIDDATAVVCMSTVHWTDGLLFDVARIARRAKEVGALMVVDATQSLGACSFSYDEIEPDLLLCSTYKWLFGPYQLGFAIVGDRLRNAEPFEHHWSNRANSEDTSKTGLLHKFRDGARRFDVGGHNNEVALAMLNSSLGQVLEWSADAVQAYCSALMSPLEDYLAASKTYLSAGPGQHAAHILGIGGRSEMLDSAIDEMTRRNIIVSRRGSVIRVSPNVYNTPGDIDALIESLEASTSTG